MRKLIITLVSIFAVIAIGLVCLLVVAINSGGLHMNGNSFNLSHLELVNTQTVALDGIDDISIEYQADDVVFYTSDSEELILKEYMNFTPKEDELTRINSSRSRLTLKGRVYNNYSHWLFSMNRSSRMEIYLPSEYSNALSVSSSSGDISSDLIFHVTGFSASSTSGDISLNEVYAERITSSASSGEITYQTAEGERSFSSTSGDIRIDSGNGNTSASSTSGSITIKNANGELSAAASSGDIRIEASSGKKDVETTSGEIVITDSDGYTEASASSGDIRISKLAGAGRFGTTSGEILVDFADDAAAINDDIRVGASSGDVSLTIPKELQFDFSAEVSSGEIDTFFDNQLSYSKDDKNAYGTIGANPSIQLDISTTSGNIRVNQR